MGVRSIVKYAVPKHLLNPNKKTVSGRFFGWTSTSMDAEMACNRPNLQHIRRTGQNESSGPSVAIRGRCQRKEQSRNRLHLIQNRFMRQVGRKAYRIGSGRSQLHIIVKGDVSIARRIADHTGQGGFTALTRPVDQHYRGIFQRLFKISDARANCIKVPVNN